MLGFATHAPLNADWHTHTYPAEPDVFGATLSCYVHAPRSALPNASGGSNICVAFTAATATNGENYVLCNGAGLSSFVQTIGTTLDTNTLPVKCDPSFGPKLDSLMEASLFARPNVAGVEVTQVGSCNVSADFLTGIYPMRVFFYVSAQRAMGGVGAKGHEW